MIIGLYFYFSPYDVRYDDPSVTTQHDCSGPCLLPRNVDFESPCLKVYNMEYNGPSLRPYKMSQDGFFLTPQKVD